ncbi:Fe/S biogenesis protein NfuA [compost metagenome]
MIKPYVKLDGGDVTFVGIRNNWALIKFSGNCSSCAAMPSTLIEIESSICDEIPSIEGIEVLQD